MHPAITPLAFATAAALSFSVYAQTLVDQNVDLLSIITTNADQDVRIEVVGPEPNVASLFGFQGIADGAAFVGVNGVTLITGAGNDKAKVEIDVGNRFDVAIDTQGGAFADVELLSQAPSASVSIDTGGATEVSAKIISPEDSQFLDISFRSAAPKTAFEVGSAASELRLDLGGSQNALTNELSYVVSQTGPAVITAKWNIQTGNGGDKIEAKIAAPDSDVVQYGEVNVRGGNDFVLFETDAFSTVTGLIIHGVAGNDEISQLIKGRFQASQTFQSRLIGGAGDDTLKLTTDTGIFGTGFPNDLFPVINCGTGIDSYDAFGRIVSCENRL